MQLNNGKQNLQKFVLIFQSTIFNTIAKRNAMNDLMLATKVPSSIPDIDVPFVRIQQVSDV